MNSTQFFNNLRPIKKYAQHIIKEAGAEYAARAASALRRRGAGIRKAVLSNAEVRRAIPNISAAELLQLPKKNLEELLQYTEGRSVNPLEELLRTQYTRGRGLNPLADLPAGPIGSRPLRDILGRPSALDVAKVRKNLKDLAYTNKSEGIFFSPGQGPWKPKKLNKRGPDFPGHGGINPWTGTPGAF